ncbi:hypothetical protein ACFFLS_02015 [Flavobacterium procerum]|uniref:Uncharacterized protein n=1 Tax=Flavobacterium procerum TaxID=1455569 RepID=A0ABV6BK38_9FLAO
MTKFFYTKFYIKLKPKLINTVNLQDIEEEQILGVLDGVTNPPLMAKEGSIREQNIY